MVLHLSVGRCDDPSKTRPLIVEKDEATRELYQRELSRTYSVITTEDAQQALEVLRTQEIAAVILEPATSDDAGWDSDFLHSSYEQRLCPFKSFCAARLTSAGVA